MGETTRVGNVSVTREPMVVSQKYLEGMDWNLNRKLGKAFTYWSFIARTEFNFAVDAARSKKGMIWLSVRGMQISLSLPITIWLPFGVAGTLHEHERGHRQICERIYALAPQAAVECAKSLVGQSFAVRAQTVREAEAVASQKLHVQFVACYKSKTEAVADQVNVLFDEITDHGLNDVSPDRGIDRAFARYEER